MSYRVFQYRLPCPPDLPDLNAYLAADRTAMVTQYLTESGGSPLLLFVVQTAGVSRTAPDGEAANSKSAPRLDYREVLSAEEFAVYSRLRAERRRLADAENIPVYTIFTNAQLAAMVQRRLTSLSGIAEIEGVGKARVEKYAVHFVPLLVDAFQAGAASPASGEPE